MTYWLDYLDLSSNPIVAVFGVIFLGIVALAKFSESIQKIVDLINTIPVAAKNIKLLKVNRRQFFLGTVSVTATVAVGYVFAGFRGGVKTSESCYSSTKEGYLIINKKTKVIHHSELCKSHLPVNVDHDCRDSKNLRIHNLAGINIYEVIARQFIRDKNYSDAIIFLKKAIEINPERVHLYDGLAKLYGREKNYSQIESLYQNGLMKISSKLAIKKDDRQLMKSKSDIEVRLNKLNQKSKMA